MVDPSKCDPITLDVVSGIPSSPNCTAIEFFDLYSKWETILSLEKNIYLKADVTYGDDNDITRTVYLSFAFLLGDGNTDSISSKFWGFLDPPPWNNKEAINYFNDSIISITYRTQRGNVGIISYPEVFYKTSVYNENFIYQNSELTEARYTRQMHDAVPFEFQEYSNRYSYQFYLNYLLDPLYSYTFEIISGKTVIFLFDALKNLRYKSDVEEPNFPKLEDIRVGVDDSLFVTSLVEEGELGIFELRIKRTLIPTTP